MMNTNAFLASSAGTVIAIVFTIITVIIFTSVIVMLWWVDVKKKPLREIWKGMGHGFMRFFGAIHDFFTANGSVKTVYSDKSLNYSGTEFLPVPTKAPTDKYTYEFVGWDKNGVDANGNTVVRAIYLQRVIRCYINVFDDDRQTLLHSAEVEYGSGVNLDDIKPTKHETREFSYEFIGWDKDTSVFYKNENVCAVYKAIPKKYTYTFLAEDEHTIINQGTAVYGTPIVAPSAPKKDPTSDTIFEFAYWRGYEENMPLVKDVNFVAVYNTVEASAKTNQTIVNSAGKSVRTEPVKQQEAPVPQRPQTVIKFKTKEEKKDDDVITSIKPMTANSNLVKPSGSSVVVQMNDINESQKFQEMNKRNILEENNDDIHQRIQLMTTKKTTGEPTKRPKVIKSVPKNKEVIALNETEVLNNMVVNRVRIDKKDN